jgi:tetratricopeptide (TPR) repeat protein
VHLAGAKLSMAFDHNLIGQQRAVLPPAAEVTRPIFTQAVEIALAALGLFERLGQSHGQIIAAQNLTEAYLYLGDLVAAENYAQQVIASRSPSVLPDGLRTLGEIRLEQRDFADAEAAIRESMQLAQVNNDRYLEAYGLRALARLYLMQENSVGAQAVFE